jgi:hypothetical protein
MLSVSSAFEEGLRMPPPYAGPGVVADYFQRAAQRYYEVLDRPVGSMDVLMAVVFAADLGGHPVTRYLNAAGRHQSKLAANP